MSQYPPNLQYHGPNPIPQFGLDPRRPARIASVLMLILGGLSFLCGVLMGISGSVVTQQMVEAQPQWPEIEAKLAQTGVTLQQLFWAMAVICAIPGLLLLVLGVLVRGGNKAVVVLSLILNGLLVLGAFVNVVSAGVTGGIAESLCVFAIPVSLCIAAMVQLRRAMSNANAIAAWKQQYQAQLLQHQQMQQNYLQTMQSGAPPGYGQPPVSPYSFPTVGYSTLPPIGPPPQYPPAHPPPPRDEPNRQ